MPEFVHLHCHSAMSLLDGAQTFEEMTGRAAELGQKAIALTDHGVRYRHASFEQAANKAGVKPIFGKELYITWDAPISERSRNNRIYHLTVLAADLEGHRMLDRITTIAHLSGLFAGRPRVDRDILRRVIGDNHGHIIALTGCPASPLSRKLLEEGLDAGRQVMREMFELFGEENVFVEVQNHYLDMERKLREGLYILAEEFGRPLVATNDCHYDIREHAKRQDHLMAIGLGETLSNPNRFRMTNDAGDLCEEYYIKSADEMYALFPDRPEACENTLLIAERIQPFSIQQKPQIPVFPNVPPGHTLRSYAAELCARNREVLYQGRPAEEKEAARLRVEQELDVMEQMGVISYFLWLWEWFSKGREMGVLFGPGRGSAAGSETAYQLGLTGLSAVHWNLPFERFINIERPDLPDFDIDMDAQGRVKMTEYLYQRYGKKHVAKVMTLGTLGAKASIRAVGRIMDLPLPYVDKIAKLVPDKPGTKLKEAVETVEMKALLESDPLAREVIDSAKLVEGFPASIGVHAAARIFTEAETVEHVALTQRPDPHTGEPAVLTQCVMGECESLNLIKYDFLINDQLRINHDAEENIRKAYGVEPPPDDQHQMTDQAVFADIGEGYTAGLFQIESALMTDWCRRIKPQKYEDLAMVLAAVRPGPLKAGIVDEIVKVRHGQKQPEYLDPRMAKHLDYTYGGMVFQEQITDILVDLCGWPRGKAEVVRKAISKKKEADLKKMYPEFMEGAVQNGMQREMAQKLWDEIVFFSEYGFSKNHAFPYAKLTYRSALLKHYFPDCYMASILSQEVTKAKATPKVALYIEETKRTGCQVLPVHINESDVRFTVVPPKGIRVGFSAIKGLPQKLAEDIVADRQADGPYRSCQEFAERIQKIPGASLSAKDLATLITVGAFDGLGANRAQLLQIHEKLVGGGQKMATGQRTLLDLMGAAQKAAVQIQPPDIPEMSRDRLLEGEFELLGWYQSGNPIAEKAMALRMAAESLRQESRKPGTVILQVADLAPETIQDETPTVMWGRIKELKQIITQKGDPMAICQLQDLTGSIKVVMFPKAYARTKDLLSVGAFLAISGSLRWAEDFRAKQSQAAANDPDDGGDEAGDGDAGGSAPMRVPELLAFDVKAIGDTSEQGARQRLTVTLPRQLWDAFVVDQIKNVLSQHKGTIPVQILMVGGERPRKVELPEDLWVDESLNYMSALQKIVGDANVAITQD